MNIVDLITCETESLRGRIAMIDRDESITYAQLLSRVDALRVNLTGVGVTAGQRIAFRCGDGIDYVVGALALLGCGAAVVPVAESLTDAEVQETVERIDVSGVFTHRDMPHRASDADQVVVDDRFRWHRRTTDSDLDDRCRDLDAAFIRFSSGTTGASKGVVLSHRSIVERTDAANRGMGITSDDVILWTLGMSHHFVVSILLFLRRGATIVVANQNFPFSVFAAATEHPITFIYGSPVHYYLLAMSDAVSSAHLSKVRLAISTSMKMPPDVGTAFMRKFGFAPAEAYGIIEIGLPFINIDRDGGGVNTVGRILPDYEVRIAHPDHEGVGEVLIRGKGMFDAYLSPWRRRDECMEDGFFKTGDLGRLDAAERLSLLGRSKTVIVCAGMKVFPEEVEAVINTIEGVTESLVIGREHPQFGQVPVAKVVLRAGAGDANVIVASLREQCCAQLSSYKVPVEFQIVPALAKTTSGKLARTSA